MDDNPNERGGSTPPVEKPTDTPATALTYPSVQSSCSASTLGQSAVGSTMMSAQQQQQQQPSGEGTRSIQRSILDQQVHMLGLLSAGSFGTFLFLFLPYSALLALGLFWISTLALFYTFYRIVILEWNTIVQGRGIGQYLPASIYEQLTSTTLHEWMTDPTFFNEYRHLLLYFIPGITQQQLDAYLARLHPRHLLALNRPGLGHYLGDEFMRIVLGESRWPPADNTSRRLVFDLDDENSSIGLDGIDLAGDDDEHERFLAPGHSPVIVVASRSTETTTAEEQRLIDQEGDILTDAVSTATAAYSYMAAETLMGYAVQAVDYVSPIVIGTGASLTFGALGVGWWGWWIGVYHPSRISAPRPHFPASRTLIATAIFGGACGSLMLLFRSAVRRSIRKERLENDCQKPKESDDKNE